MLEILYAGGWVMVPIIFCSILAVAIIAERFWALRRRNVIPAGVGEQVEEWAARHELDKRHIDQLSNTSALGRVLAAALANRHRPRDLIKESVEDTGRHVLHDLERFLDTLGTIAGISPLLGLLGTVFGMIKVFSAISIQGVGNANALAGGIAEALITTAAGLLVAIPSYFFYRYFKGKVNMFVISMEAQAISLIEAIERGHVARLGNRVPGGLDVKFRARESEELTIDLTSLIDVVFLLLIFFMVSTTFERQAVLKVNLPEASTVDAPTDIPDKLELVIDPAGKMFLNDLQLVDDQRPTMVAALLQAAGERRDIPLVLRADRMTPHHYVVMAMDVAAELGFVNLSIATDRGPAPEDSGDPRE